MGDIGVPKLPDGRRAPVTARASVPARPVIRPSEFHDGPPYPLLDSLSPTIGWQERPGAKGGRTFVVIRRSILGSLKVLERFPLTDEGWAEAWQALVQLSPDAAEKIRVRLAERSSEDRNLQRPSPLAELDARSFACLREVALLGGYAPDAEIAVGQRYDLRLLEDRLIVVPCRQPEVLGEVPYSDVEAVDIGGPGLAWSAGGFVGGGFRVKGAVEGIATAAVLNVLTTQASIKTVIRVQAANCELFLLYTETAPEQLRFELSRALRAIRLARASAVPTAQQHREPTRSTSPAEELTKLASLLESGLLSREEFDRLKAKILADSW